MGRKTLSLPVRFNEAGAMLLRMTLCSGRRPGPTSHRFNEAGAMLLRMTRRSSTWSRAFTTLQ